MSSGARPRSLVGSVGLRKTLHRFGTLAMKKFTEAAAPWLVL